MNAIEQAIAQRCISDLLEAGYLVSVYHDTQPILDRSCEAGAILASMGSAGEEVLWIRDTKDQRVGWISFRYGSSSAANVITDYTPNLEPILEQTNTLIGVMRSLELITPEAETNLDCTEPNAIRGNNMDDIIVDRSMVRRLVEDFWRSLVLYDRHLGETQPNLSRDEHMRLSQDFSRRWQERNQATAATMPPEQARMFLRMIDEEDDICFQEHQRNPDAFYRRLGLNLTSDPKPTRQPVVYHRQSFGEMAVRTAVRATIWELIWSLFRR
jgi:hypothetical protein